LGQPAPPDVEPGRQCTEPVLCEFYDHCNPDVAADHVSFLPRMRTEKVDDLIASGIMSVHQIPDEFPLSETQRRAVDAVKSGRCGSARISWRTLHFALPNLLYGLRNDISGTPEICRDATIRSCPVSMVCPSARASWRANQALRFLGGEHLRSTAPIPGIAVPSDQAAGSIVVYNQGFEASRLDDLADGCRGIGPEIAKIKAKLWDLLAVIRRSVYHPAFGGSFL